MSSLETIKQELIRQKSLLERKGFSVPIANRNPTPTEISNAINDIDVRFTETTATEQDVRAGKTFISQTQGIRTGTLDIGNMGALWDIINCMVSGQPLDIMSAINSDTSRIRPHAFYSSTEIMRNVFYTSNFELPSHVTYIGEYAFAYADIQGKVVIPNTCTTLSRYAFAYTNITEVEVYSGILENSNYLFSNCKKLKKATLGPNIKFLPSYMFTTCTTLEEIIIQTSDATWGGTVVYNTSSVKRVIFESPEPLTVKSTGFQYLKTAALLVPYLYYDVYFNATNYQQYSNPMYGYGNFLTGRPLPSEQDTYSLVWYASLDDLQAGTNPVTTCAEDGRYYAVFTNTENTNT